MTSAPARAGTGPSPFTRRRAAAVAPSRRSDFRGCFERCRGTSHRSAAARCFDGAAACQVLLRWVVAATSRPLRASRAGGTTTCRHRKSSQGRGGSATSPIGLHSAGAANSRRQLRAAARHRHSASACLGLGYHNLLTRAQRVCSARWAVTAEKLLFRHKRLGLSGRETQVPYLRSSDRVVTRERSRAKVRGDRCHPR